MPPLGAPFQAPIATPGGGVAPVTLILDQFTDANGTALTAHTIAPTNTPEASWTNASGPDLTIQSNNAQLAGGAGANRGVTVNAGQADVSITCLVNMSVVDENTTVGILVRGTNDLAAYDVQLTDSAFRIVLDNAGVVATTAFSAVGGVDYTIKVVCVGANITATLDGAHTITATDTTHTANTSHGLRPVSLGASIVAYDNFTITTP